MYIHGNQQSRDRLSQRVGNLAQLGGTRRIILNEGAGKGIEAIEVDTGAGLHFSVLIDRAMDISQCRYKGTNLVYLTPNGEVHPAFYEAADMGWLHTFAGGLLTTCGLTTLGPPGTDGDDALGLHGRVSTLPARQVQDRSRWEDDRYVIELVGTIQEARLFGHCLEMTRTIRTELGSRALTVEDQVRNAGYQSSPLTMLYHVNAGYPLLDATSTLVATARRVEAHDEQSRGAVSACRRFTAPVPGFLEQNFLFQMESAGDGWAHAAMLNPGLGEGLGLALAFRPAELPYLNEWKMMGQRDYVVGIEPCNVPCANRADLRAVGLLPMLEPGETQTHHLRFNVLEGSAELQTFEESYARVPADERFTRLLSHP